MLGFGGRTWKQNDGQGWRFICCRYGDIVWRLASCPTSEKQYSVAACLLLQRLTSNSNTAIYLSDYLRPQTEIHSFNLKCDKRASIKTPETTREKRKLSGSLRVRRNVGGFVGGATVRGKRLVAMGNHHLTIAARGKLAKCKVQGKVCYALRV